MSFGTGLALLIGLIVAAPVVAHLLRRGQAREQVFPPTNLVPMVVVTSEQRSRIEDRLLLLMRALMVLALAILGATPFVRCSRLSVDRHSGASVALAIVIDDSQSMRASDDSGTTRFQAAIAGAHQLLSSAREGDAIAVIRAGSPPRLALSPTPDLSAVARTLDSVEPTDRSTDLSEAIGLARASLRELPHADKRVVLLSDLAVKELPDGEPANWMPLPELSEPRDNCGISSAERQGRGVLVTVGCSNARAAAGRSVHLRVAGETDSDPLQTHPLRTGEGEQKISLKQISLGFDLTVELSGADAIQEDNVALVAKETTRLQAAVIADTSKASAITGGATVIEQALAALSPDLDVKPLGSIPVASEDLAPFAAILIDDPPGLSPESRAALNAWIKRGGVAAGFLGQSSASAELASSLEPFARPGAIWEKGTSKGVDLASLGWLGEESSSLADLNEQGRVRLDAAELPGASVLGRWKDGAPLLLRRAVQNGLVLTVGLPASVAISDLSLRPAFLALLDEVLSQARSRTGPKRSVAGTPWLFPVDEPLVVTGPRGPLTEEDFIQGDHPQKQVIPDVAGRYEVRSGNKKEWRFVTVSPAELTTPPLKAGDSEASAVSGSSANQVDASPEWAILLLCLFSLELLYRAFGEQLKRRFRRRRWA